MYVSAVFAKTDSELRKRLETLEARILELEARLEVKGGKGTKIPQARITVPARKNYRMP